MRLAAGPLSDPFINIKPFDATLLKTNRFPLTALSVKTLQINMGLVCNQSCKHCHVEAGPAGPAAPDRPEVSSKTVLDKCLDALTRHRIPEADLTGGAPEMNPHYRWFVKGAASVGARVKTRTNLTILLEEGFEDLPRFWAENLVEVIASLPYYLADTVDRQRGAGVFDSSIEAIKRLNEIGYGVEGSSLTLNLVYNPCGAFMPPQQKSIETDFRREMQKRYGVSFNNLFTITNMPVGRFLKFLSDSGNLEPYIARLQSSYNPSAVTNVMCRNTVSVGWDGTLYDCDFNQALGLKCGFNAPDNINAFDVKTLSVRRIVTGPHCYGCTAGAGSSCTGATV